MRLGFRFGGGIGLVFGFGGLRAPACFGALYVCQAAGALCLGNQVPYGDEQRGDDRADDKAVETEQFETRQRGNQHHEVGHAGVAADEDRAQQVIDHADDEHAAEDHHPALDVVSGRQQVASDGNPDDTGADGRQQREEAHQHAPQEGAFDAESREDQAADKALHHCDDDGALHRGAYHQHEMVEQRIAQMRPQRDRGAHQFTVALTIAQQEEREVKHHAQRSDEAEGALPDDEQARGDVLQATGDAGAEFAPQRLEIGGCVACDRVADLVGQGGADALEHGTQIDLPAADPIIKRRRFLYEAGSQEQGRQDEDRQQEKQHQRRGRIGPASKLCLQFAGHRFEQDRRDDAPEHRPEIGCEKPGEGDGNEYDEADECVVFKAVCRGALCLHWRSNIMKFGNSIPDLPSGKTGVDFFDEARETTVHPPASGGHSLAFHHEVPNRRQRPGYGVRPTRPCRCSRAAVLRFRAGTQLYA
ncbi:hypothetical protein SPHV1_2430128 [Novosphingobium sp. KN65.2]|nr:hypothetical protein SPHV1_2430128 [Novosphingobium sp. KN65.2]